MFFFLLIFLSGFIIDIFWTLYIKSVSENKKLSAAIYSTLQGLCQTFFIFSFVNDFYYAIPWLTGLFSGTYCSFYVNDFINNFLKNKK